MNPLTLVKRIQNINQKEANLGISEDASWHAKYKDSAYVFVGGIPFDLTEGDLLAVFAQYGEIVDVNLVRDKATGKSKGFAFLAYEDQRSTNLAVDNLNGAQVLGRIIRVDHVNKYKKLEEEDEETRQMKREERGVCRAFQRGECKYGDSCKFSHDEQRAANTGWGVQEDRNSRWAQDKYEDSDGYGGTGQPRHAPREGHRRDGRDSERPRAKGNDPGEERSYKRIGLSEKDSERKHRDDYDGNNDRRPRHRYDEPNSREEHDGRDDKRSKRSESKSFHGEDKYSREREPNSKEERDERNDKRSRRYESESYHKEEKYSREQDRRSVRDRENSQHRRRRGEDE